MSCVALNHKQPVNQAVKWRREPFHSGLLNVNQSKWLTLQPSQRQVLSLSPFYIRLCVYSHSLILFVKVLSSSQAFKKSIKYMNNCVKIERNLLE